MELDARGCHAALIAWPLTEPTAHVVVGLKLPVRLADRINADRGIHVREIEVFHIDL